MVNVSAHMIQKGGTKLAYDKEDLSVPRLPSCPDILPVCFSNQHLQSNPSIKTTSACAGQSHPTLASAHNTITSTMPPTPGQRAQILSFQNVTGASEKIATKVRMNCVSS